MGQWKSGHSVKLCKCCASRFGVHRKTQHKQMYHLWPFVRGPLLWVAFCPNAIRDRISSKYRSEHCRQTAEHCSITLSLSFYSFKNIQYIKHLGGYKSKMCQNRIWHRVSSLALLLLKSLIVQNKVWDSSTLYDGLFLGFQDWRWNISMSRYRAAKQTHKRRWKTFSVTIVGVGNYCWDVWVLFRSWYIVIRPRTLDNLKQALSSWWHMISR